MGGAPQRTKLVLVAKKSPLVFLRQDVAPAVACFLVALGLAQTSVIERIENLTLDYRTQLRAKFKPSLPSDRLAVIGIDEASLRRFGRWPWPREDHANFLQLSGLRAPKVSAWDILFTESGPHDSHLAKSALKGAAGAVVFGAMQVLEGEGIAPTNPGIKETRLVALPRVEGDKARVPQLPEMLLPAADLAKVADIGFVDTPPEVDGVRRYAPMVVRVGDQFYPTLSLRSLMVYWNAEPDNVVIRLGEAIELNGDLGKRRIPIDASGRYRINYLHRSEDFTGYGYGLAYDQLLARYEEKPGPVPILTGRILLVGQVAEGLSDFGPTPFAPLTPLVVVHANAIDNILNEDYLHPVSGWVVWLGAFAIGLVGVMRFAERKLWEQATYAFGIPVAYGIASTALWVSGSWVLPIVGPLLGFGALQLFMIGKRVLLEQRAKEQIKGMFGSYVSPELVSRLVNAGEMPRLGGHEEEITAYFSDIQSFSTFSEMLPPDRLVELMNEYLTACTDIVQGEGGTLDKYIGDAVVAMYGAPITLADHAYRACVAAVRVQRRLGELREKWKGEGDKWPEIVQKMQSRIGLNSGSAVVGNMGSRTRFNYTMMGDNVNLAARMESGAKSWGTYIMCAEATKTACEQHGGDHVIFRPLGRIVVKGRSRAVPIFEIVDLKEFVAPRTGECIEIFSRGLEHYYRKEWRDARASFERSGELEFNIPGKTPGVMSNPSLVYLDIVARFEAEGTPDDWDGVYVMKEK